MNSISAKTKINMIIGDPIEHSLSPQMHNAAYETLGIVDQYIFIAAHIKPQMLQKTVDGFRAMQFNGLTCTVPYKTSVIPFLDEVDETARHIGAVNTIVNEHGKLKGYNTDWLGVVVPLEKITTLKNKKVAILGAGGAARAAAYGLIKKGANVTIFNRTIETAQFLTKEFGCAFASLQEYDLIQTMDIIFNATLIGLPPHDKVTPLPKQYITDKHIVFDAVYKPYETTLLREAKHQGATVIHGLEMLLYQGLEQFRLYTKREASEESMRKVLEKYVKN